MPIDPNVVEQIVLDCLFRDDEPTDAAIRVEGIATNYGFHPARLAAHRDQIVSMLMELPETFRASVGGGWSFLMACNDKHGNLWTGLHVRMEQLFALGMAIGRVKCQSPIRAMWEILPGGVPYYSVIDEGADAETQGDQA